MVKAARDKAHVLYEGKQVPHRSCGIALAETFGLGTRPYQALRRGGITGCGTCGAIRAGEQILGEILGDPDPTGAVTEPLREALTWYQAQVPRRIDRGPATDYVCNSLTEQFADEPGGFRSSARHRFCTGLAAEVAALTAETLTRFAPAESLPTITPIPDSDSDTTAATSSDRNAGPRNAGLDRGADS